MLRELGRENDKDMGFEVHAYAEMRLRGESVSSSHIRKLLAEGRVSRARHLLGRPFSILSICRPRTRLRGKIHGSDDQSGALRRARTQGRCLYNPHKNRQRAKERVFRFRHQRWKPADIWSRFLCHRNAPAEFPSDRTFSRDRSRNSLSGSSARRDQISVGRSSERSNRAGCAESAKIFAASGTEGSSFLAVFVFLGTHITGSLPTPCACFCARVGIDAADSEFVPRFRNTNQHGPRGSFQHVEATIRKSQRMRLRFHAACSIVYVIFAVFSSMAETEQYFSFDNRTASSMLFFDTWP